MPARKDIHAIMVIGSGPIIIGQACEFDYSGCQAIQALQEDGYRVILVNPNPATMMTTPGIADAIYMDPITPEYLEEIIRIERPDALLPTMGGQTALNAAITLDTLGILDRHSVELIGARIDAIKVGEDRGLFRDKMDEIGLQSARSRHIKSTEEAQTYAAEIGFPLIIRPSFTLGGQGGQIVQRQEDLPSSVQAALQESDNRGILIEESLLGWGEFELEVMRDRKDNVVIVCGIENVDPMGIHTGDSITVAPPQTLPDVVYQRMRTAAIDILRAVGVDCGGSNVQFAYNPANDQIRVIEMNPRVSRSSALASKATGFPIARCATRLAVGYELSEIINDITKKTNACFEPSLDYCAVKVARFEIGKFKGATTQLGSSMKAIGEALSLGRTFIEALNKALRAAEIGYHGLQPLEEEQDALYHMLTSNHPHRILAAFTLLWRGSASVDAVAAAGGYHPWFVAQIQDFVHFCHRIAARTAAVDAHSSSRTAEYMHAKSGDADSTTPTNSASADSVDAAVGAHTDSGNTASNFAYSMEAKRFGMSNAHIVHICQQMGTPPPQIAHIPAVFHCVDTCAGEFEAYSTYYYSTYGEVNESVPLVGDKVLIIGSGPNRIGQGLEFDTCCTLCARAYIARGVQTVMVNSNPETVSTDYNISSRLYLEPVESESIISIMEHEQIKKVIVQLGGQTALNMAHDLQEWGAEIVGTSLHDIHAAEDRTKFSALVDRLGMKIPRNYAARSKEEIITTIAHIGYPVLLRPSFVLGGARMAIIAHDAQLDEYLLRISPTQEINLQIDEFIEDAFEYDIDALSDGENVYIAGIMEHIESAGIHSGDSACVFPPYKYRQSIKNKMVTCSVAIARALKIKGFMNIQFAAKGEDLYIIEVNPRVSRTVPFISKTSGVNLVEAVVDIWRGKTLVDIGLVSANAAAEGAVGVAGMTGVAEGHPLYPYSIKEAVFSFSRFPNFDPQLGPEMRSTGESIGIGDSFGAAYAKATAAAGVRLPTHGAVGISVNDSDKDAIVPLARSLKQLGFSLFATTGTAQTLVDNGILCEVLLKAHEGHPNMIDYIKEGRMHFVINTPFGGEAQHDDSIIRVEALRHRIPYTTTTSAAEAAVEGIVYLRKKKYDSIKLQSTALFNTTL